MEDAETKTLPDPPGTVRDIPEIDPVNMLFGLKQPPALVRPPPKHVNQRMKEYRARKERGEAGKPGRPEVIIDWNQATLAAVCHRPVKEIAAWCGVNEATFRRAVKREYGVSAFKWKKHCQKRGKVGLAIALHTAAVNGTGNPRLLLALAKQHLGYDVSRLRNDFDRDVDGKIAETIIFELPDNQRGAGRTEKIVDVTPVEE